MSGLIACGEDSFCETVDCDEAAATSSTSGSSTTTADGSSASTTASGSGGSGAQGVGGSEQGGGDSGGSGGGGGGGGGAALAVTPGDTKVGILRPLQFAANTPVEWSVEESDGGTIDDSGRYVSPEEPGVFHVVATRAEDPAEIIEVEVTVAPLGLEIAGGIPGGAGNLDGQATRARFNAPRGFGVLGGGDFLVADTGNHTLRIYREDEDEVTTFAGAAGVAGFANGIGAAARFDGPSGVVVDGDLAFVVDDDGTCIRSVDLASAQVTTFAGACGVPGDVNGATGAQSRFDGIEGMVLAPDGTGLILCHRPGGGATELQRINGETGATTSLNVEGFNRPGPCSMSAAPVSELVFIHAGGDDRRVRALTMNLSLQIPLDVAPIPGSNNVLSALAFLPSQEVLYAFDRERESAGTPYVTTLHSFAIGGSAFTELAGAAMDYVDGPLATARFLTPGFLVPDGNQLYLGDQEGHTVRRIDFDGVDAVETVLGARANVYAVDGPSTEGRLLFPFSVALGDDEAGDQDLYVAGTFFDRVIRRIDGSTGAIETFSGVRENYIIDTEPSFDAPVDGQAGQAVFGAIADMVRIGDALYVADLFSAIRRVSLDDGAVETIAGALGQTGFADGFGVAARFDFSSEILGAGLATDGVDLFVSDPGNFAVRKIDMATGEVTTVAGGTEGTTDGTGESAQFVSPAGLAYDRGILFVADAGAHTIRRLDLDTMEVTTLTGRANFPGDANGSSSQARFASPYRLVADGLGNLFVTSAGVGEVPHTIRRIRLDGVDTSTFAGEADTIGFADGALPASLGCPFGLAIDASGDLVFADACDGAIGAIRLL